MADMPHSAHNRRRVFSAASRRAETTGCLPTSADARRQLVATQMTASPTQARDNSPARADEATVATKMRSVLQPPDETRFHQGRTLCVITLHRRRTGLREDAGSRSA
jgi:hypothetical protein